MSVRLRLLIAAMLCLCAGGVHAARVVDVQVRGLDEDMTRNVRQSLSLVDAMDRELSQRRLAYLVREAEDEVREALEPFGHYAPEIRISGGEGEGAVTVVVDVNPGPPVRVRRARVEVAGPARDEPGVSEDLAEFEPRVGDVFDHELYETGKTRITRRLAEYGYFDADFDSRRVEVTRAELAADIDLAWRSGERYALGHASFTQTPRAVVRDDLLHRLVDWAPGTPYHQRRIDRLRESLRRLDYFASIDVEPRPDEATDRQVPIVTTLIPAKRDVYTAGLSFGTDSGAGVRAGVERRYVNMRGHKALAQIDYAQRRKTLTLQYRIPAFAWLDGWYTFSAQAADEQTDYIDTRRIEFVASRSGEINQFLTAVASGHALRERWAYAAEDDLDPETPVEYRYGTFTYGSLRGEYIDVDSRLHPRRGLGGTLMVRGGVEGAGSDVSFAQAHATARWYRGLDDRSRLLVRGELGHTFVDAPVGSLPPSLRFHAGGERSIRGYAWREVGPRIGAEGRLFAVGARKVATASVEYERFFTERWGGAVFVDSGSAFNDSPDWRTGVGVGVRWRSPVGPLRVDIARGLDSPDSSFQLYLSMGAEL